MSDSYAAPISTRELFTNACDSVLQTSGASGLLVGLPEQTRQRTRLDGIAPLDALAVCLPEATRPPAAQGGGGADWRLPGSLPAWTAGAAPGPDFSDWLAFPLILQESAPGLVVLVFPAGSSNGVPNLDASLRLLAGAIELALSREAAAGYKSSLEALHTISLRMASTLDLYEVLNTLAEASLELLPASAVHIYLHQTQESEQPFTFGVALGEIDGRPAAEAQQPKALLNAAASRTWPLLIDDLAAHPLGQILIESGWKVAMLHCYPLARGARLLGYYLLSYQPAIVLSPDEHYLVSLLIDQAMLAISNAQTAINLSYRLAEMTALQRLSEKISTGLHLQPALQAAADTIRDLLDASTAGIMLFGPGGSLHLAATAGDPAQLPDPPVVLPGSGFAGRVAVSHEQIYLPDARLQAGLSPLNPAVRSLFVEPLIAQNQLVGTITLVSSRPYAFGSNSARLIAIIAAKTAAVVWNNHLYTDEQQHRGELQILVELGQSLAQESSFESIFKATYHAVRSQMTCDAFIISLSDQQTDETVAIYMIDRDTRFASKRGHRDTGLSGYIISTGQKLRVDDLESESPPFSYAHFGTSRSVRALVAAPLVSGQEVIGMLAAQSYQPAAFNEHNLEMLAVIADYVTGAVRHAILRADLEARCIALQRTNQACIENAQNLSHELRAPLTFLKGYIHLFLDESLGPLSTYQRQALGVIQAKTEALERLATEIFEQPTDPDNGLHLQALDLRRIIQDALGAAQIAAARRGLALAFQPPFSFPTLVADPDRITQVLDNLLSNAIKFAYPDSQVIVTLQVSDNWAQVSISNQGDLIPPQEQARLFDRFYRGHLSEQQPGAGLGLAITRHIVRAHGGQVWVESKIDTGNTFHFTLPVRQPESKLDNIH